LARERQEELRRDLAEAQSAADAVQAGGSAEQNVELARLRESLQTARAESERLADELQHASRGSADAAEQKKLRAERDSLQKKLAEAERQLAAAADNDGDAQSKDDLRRRFEMAVEELREVKRANAELETKLKKAGSGTAAIGGGGGALDWEAQKQKLMAAWDDDGDDDDEERAAERQSIEGTSRITDQIVAQKDEEIEELKRQLEEYASSRGASDDKAVAELLDGDDIIRQEREKLQQAEAEWRQKIGQAEIDISVERARIARERMELEEKMRVYQADQATRPPDAPAGATEKPVRGRWLARLGLKDLNDE
jgi:hypothetical protein